VFKPLNSYVHLAECVLVISLMESYLIRVLVPICSHEVYDTLNVMLFTFYINLVILITFFFSMLSLPWIKQNNSSSHNEINISLARMVIFVIILYFTAFACD